MSGDEKLIEAYRNAQDIHRTTASQVFHIPFDEVTDLQRRNAKAVNFGIVYGISSFGLSQDLSITKKEAAEYIERYFETYPKIKGYLDGLVAVSYTHLDVYKRQLLGATGTRLDHVLGNIELLGIGLKAGIPIQICDAHNRIRMIDRGMTLARKEQFGTYVSLIPYTECVEHLTLDVYKRQVPLYSANILWRNVGSDTSNATVR